ncbi:hypothetical protein SLS60_007342 [Paraconiothyrium brasiliense]|uniref:Kynurenine formamidase n=1 Tax=Paraconiothyrium brasiliense TaxID=300254 RepID=A0ABR3R534_9PLEO
MSYSRDPNIPHLTHHASIPYKPHATRLQTLDIWLPSHPTSPNSTQTSPKPGTWIIYLHGGAWRDPTQDSLCAIPTLRALTTTHPSLLHSSIAGIASLNYRLSPYPSHATNPSTPDDVSRNVSHPSHVQDVRDALAYLINEYAVESWIGVGHSCGATLLLQLPLLDQTEQIRESLRGLVLLAGIYDVPLFLASHAPPMCPEHIAKIYRDIVAGAFGEEESVYAEVSPRRFGKGWLWGRYVVLGYSQEDELVEAAQREGMLGRYLEEGWVRSEREGGGTEAKVVDVRDLKMGHDEVWEDGEQIAKLVAEVVEKVGAR